MIGGFKREGFYLVQGDPGPGKTTLALQYARDRTKAGRVVSLRVVNGTRQDLDNACASHGWTMEGIQVCDLSRSPANVSGQSEMSVFHPSETELGDTTKAIIAEVERVKPKHTIFDGLAESAADGRKPCATAANSCPSKPIL